MLLSRLRERNRTQRGEYAAFKARYRNDPAGFVADCFTWKDGECPTAYQREILSALSEHRRVAVRGPHGLGKSALAAWVILWLALVWDGDTDWKVPTTAGSWAQLTHYLWPEVHKWAARLRWDRIGRPPFKVGEELLTLNLKLSTGEAFAIASDRAELVEGSHASVSAWVYDESKAISDAVFDASEGAFAAPNAQACYAFAISTPGEPHGRFWAIHTRAPGLEDWWVRHVRLEEAIRGGRVGANWAGKCRDLWGEGSAVYQNRVLGEFAASEEDGVIPLAWVEKANERWNAWHDAGQPADFIAVGVDVARSGEDKTVLAFWGECDGLRVITELRRYSREDTMATTGRVDGVLRAYGGEAIVDVIGVGAGVVDRLRERRRRVLAFNASERATTRDKSGELGFTNLRSAAWWAMREMLDPANGEAIALPPDDKLTGDLTAPHWRVVSGGRIEIESKDDIRKRIGRSTDDGDAVVMAFWQEPQVEQLDADELPDFDQGHMRRVAMREESRPRGAYTKRSGR